jgi:hypothetical protein
MQDLLKKLIRIGQQVVIAGIILATFFFGLAPILAMRFGGGVCDDFFCKSVFVSAGGGLIGGAMYMARGFYQAVMGHPKPFNFPKFFWWYVFRPILSAACGVIGFLLVYLAFDIQETFKNMIGFLLGGLLIGYNLNQFLDRQVGAIGAAAVDGKNKKN